MKTYLTEVPRAFMKFDAMDVDEAKVVVLDEMNKIVNSPATIIEDVTGKPFPTAEEARSSKNKGLAVRIANVVGQSININKVTGGRAFLGMGGADILINDELCKSLSLSDASAVDTKSTYLSLGRHLDTLSAAGGRTVNEEKVVV